MDSDDYLLSFCLEQRVKAVLEFPKYNFLVFPMGELKGHNIIKKEIPLSENYLINFLSADLPWSIMCPIWKREFLLQLKGFTEGYPRFNDPELMIRALLLPNVNFKVFHDFKHDTVYIPSLKDKSLFTNKVYDSLLILIPDISKKLEMANKGDFKKYLTHYLHLWFKYVYFPSHSRNIVQPTHLIWLFCNNKIISYKKSLSLFLRFLLYAFSNYFFSKPINKLISKSLYFQ